MNITNTPADYKGAFNEIIYNISDANPTQGVDVSIYDSLQQTVLGIKRFRGETNYVVNVANYIQQQFDINPISHHSCAIITDANRLKSVSIQLDQGAMSTKSWHTFGVLDAQPLCKLSNSCQRVKIAPGECDEISFLAPSMELQTEITLLSSVNAENFHITLTPVVADHNIHSLIINMVDIEQKLEEHALKLSDFRHMMAVISAGSHEFIRQEYTIVPHRKSSIRLCWLNQYGVIDYYTCAARSSQIAAIESSKIYAEHGFKNIGAQTLQHSTLISEYESELTMQWLAEIIASPQVWIVREPGVYTPINIRSQSVIIRSANLARLEISATEISKIFSQKN